MDYSIDLTATAISRDTPSNTIDAYLAIYPSFQQPIKNVAVTAKYRRAIDSWDKINRKSGIDGRFSKHGKRTINGIVASIFADCVANTGGRVLVLDNRSVTSRLLAKCGIERSNITVVEQDEDELDIMQEFVGPTYVHDNLGDYLCGSRRYAAIWADFCATIVSCERDIKQAVRATNHILAITLSVRVVSRKKTLARLKRLLKEAAQADAGIRSIQPICAVTYGITMLFIMLRINRCTPNDICVVL